MIKFCVGVLMFDCSSTIVKMLNNCGSFVDKIYVTYSKIPWDYDKAARIYRQNTTDKNIIHLTRYYDKIELIEGEWKTDEEQRNDILFHAKSDGYDYLIIQDADEFYTHPGYRANLRYIRNHPDYELYLTKFIPFWKDLQHVLVNGKGEFTGRGDAGFSEFALNLQYANTFIKSRLTSATNKIKLPSPCYHLSYVHPDVELWRKISQFAHCNEFDKEVWYLNKWVKWDENTKNLHPLKPSLWKRAVLYEGELPEEIDYD